MLKIIEQSYLMWYYRNECDNYMYILFLLYFCGVYKYTKNNQANKERKQKPHYIEYKYCHLGSDSMYSDTI
jgi:hypothetical protein